MANQPEDGAGAEEGGCRSLVGGHTTISGVVAFALLVAMTMMLILKMLLPDAAPNGDHGGGDPIQLNIIVLLINSRIILNDPI